MRERISLYLLKGLLSFILIALSIWVYPVTVILTSDKQLDDLTNPDKKIDLSTGLKKRFASLREICEEAQSRNDKSLVIAFDEFFRQYREQAGTVRSLTPDMDEYVSKIGLISAFAKTYGLGIGLSLLSPLDIGPGFVNKTGQSGRWLHYTTGVRDPGTGKFRVELWRQLYWTNNKGKIRIKLKGVKAWSFREKVINNGRLNVVRPEDIHPITSEIKMEMYDTTTIIPAWEPSSLASDVVLPVQRINLYQESNQEWKEDDRIFVVLEYETPEMDYFSPDVPGFLNDMLSKYHTRGINLTTLYSDEMHIQQDWYYFSHHDKGQFSVRYLTGNMAKAYAANYGNEYSDMDKYMLYFVYGPNSYLHSPYAITNTQYVMGETAEDIQRTVLFRDRYYKMLNNKVTDLFIEAKKYVERLYQRELSNGAHASWAQSPTIDLWDTGDQKLEAYQYEYTPNFIWSNAVQQASAACYDYFKWGEYLQPTGNDFAECGWLDRNYYGAAMATSIGVINKYPNAYAAYWGMPEQAKVRKEAINSAFGARANRAVDLMTGHVHRDVDVLILYPMNLVAAEERFGSWMAQYGYANYITSDKLLELGKLTGDGRIRIAEKTYSTLVAVFEPLPKDGLLNFMNDFADSGGRLIWFGPPPLLDDRGVNCSSQWTALFNAEYKHTAWQGKIAAGKMVSFEGRFKNVPQQTILTDFLVDRIYPVTPLHGAIKVAQTDGMTIGVESAQGKGRVFYFGFRPRDDQSASLGYEMRTLFEILDAAGAYPSSGKFPEINDNTEYVSRNTDYFTTRFPNGTTMIVRHYRTHRENWPDGFSRDPQVDNLCLLENPMPPDDVLLRNFKVNGHNVSFEGKLSVGFRLNGKQELIAFDGRNCNGITLDGKNYVFSDSPVERISFGPENEEMTSYYLIIRGEGKIRIPVGFAHAKKIQVTAPEKIKVAHRWVEGMLEVNISREMSGKQLKIAAL